MNPECGTTAPWGDRGEMDATSSAAFSAAHAASAKNTAKWDDGVQ